MSASDVLRSLFDWLDLHPGSYWLPIVAATSGLLIRIGRRIIRENREGAPPPRPPGWVDALLVFLFLLAWRWPFLLDPREYNPDESQMIAGAMTLAHDPAFWRSVDGGSSGPLNYWLLTPWAWLGLPLDYFTARLTGLLLIGGALFFCLRSLARPFGHAAAWLGILPAAAFFASASHPELANLSTEHLPLFFIALSFWLLSENAPASRIRLWSACFLAGALPWAKLQAGPIGLALLGWAGWQVWRQPGRAARLRFRDLAEIVAAAALPALLLAGMVAAAGLVDAAWRRFILQNFVYVGKGNSATLAEAVRAMWHNAEFDGRLPLFLYTTGAGLLLAMGFLAWRRVRPSPLVTAGAFVTFAAVTAVITPRRDYLHYALLLPVPVTLWFGAAIGEWWRHWPAVRLRLALAGLGLAAGVLPLITRALRLDHPPVYGSFAYNWRHPRSSAAEVLHALTGPGDTLATWGWAGYLHVESGLRQATRDANSLWSVEPNPQQAYFRTHYLADLQRSAPAVFVDSVGPGAFFYQDRRWQSHEHFPDLDAYIRQHYTLVTDWQDARIYARNDLPGLGQLNCVRLRQLRARGYDLQKFTAPPGSGLDPLQRRTIAQHDAVMLHPPTRVEWALNENVQEVSIEFGFDPAENAPAKSDGAQLNLELVDGPSTTTVFQRFLDPGRHPEDRGRQSARVVLPRFGRGATLVLRTDQGPQGDGAWDWLYLASLRFHQNKHFRQEQFPGFSRVPDRVDDDTLAHLEENPPERFTQHAPARLSFDLHGDERDLRFNYGLQPTAGAGAVCRVELQSEGQPPRVLFERYLQPADRASHHADLQLPALHPGDILTVKTNAISPGGPP